ncbi:GntR family transcriptional regulator [Streptomyces sp. WAC05858]|uniref:GntR family transcriptional regulator n=1 Tax=Streptomyces TaxID=1883 RepID=UPI000F7AF1F5|nr:GntR family transcriptional regulator [Streptomyces sp. WAC05858]RSS34699.1 GntR family transcriptional regulator [Streptomyces sp. WAC05858]
MTDEQQEEGMVWSTQDQIAAYLRDGILSGEFPPGSKLPSSRKLTEMFGAASQTIRNAIITLEKERLAYSRQGSGVIVRAHPQHTMEPAKYKDPPSDGGKYQWITAAEKKGSSGGSELLAVEEVDPPAAVRAAFGLEESERVVRRQQILFLNEKPCELVEVFVPLDLAQGTPIAEFRRIRGGTGRVLAEAGWPTIHCVDKVSARWPTPEQARALRMPTKLPVLRTFRVTYSTGGRPIQAEIMAKAGHLYELQYEF